MNKHKKLYYFMLIATILMIVAFAVSLLVWTELNNWIPFAVICPVFIILFVCTIVIYMKYVKFICHKCNQTFKASKSAILWAVHTPTKRYIKCPHCNAKSWCKEDFE